MTSTHPSLNDLVRQVLEGQPRAVARAISLVEDEGEEGPLLIRRLYEQTGRGKVVGITGPPGAGKSTVVDRLARRLRKAGEKVGILAVDPTSPFSGGALLGDRIRMQALYTDPGVFIRSMATRGAMGGLAQATHDAIDVVDAAGFDWILLETVGVGQDEVDVVRSVDTVLVVTVPGLGDDIQAIKAGIMEIADIFVINKADRDGVERTQRDLELMLSMAEETRWRPPIVKTVASQDQGVEELLEEVKGHRRWLEETEELARRRRIHLRLRVENILKQRVLATARHLLDLDREIERAYAQRMDPYRLARRVYREVVEAERQGGGGETAAGVEAEAASAGTDRGR